VSEEQDAGIKGEERPQEIRRMNGEREQERLRLLQELRASAGELGYGKRQEKVAQKLGITCRSVRRLLRHLGESGAGSVVRSPRRDRGEARIGSEWEQYIVKTYVEGNRGSCKLNPLQVWVRVKIRAEELGTTEYPSHMTVYRVLRPLIEKKRVKKGTVGWRGDRLTLKTREGLEIGVEWSNQVWQADHTQVDVLVVDASGSVLGRPWLTMVIDTYSRCVMGINLGFDRPSAAVVCLALRHAILPKQYSSSYELQKGWDTYGLPQYLYTDGGKDFRSQHLEQVATALGIVLCLRRKPSDGGIVERPFGTLNSQLFSTMPGYVNSDVVRRSPKAETEACLTLVEMERLLVRYIVDHYNQSIDARMGDQSRIGRWDAGRIAQLGLLSERELDLCLMRRERRMVYRSGYIQFANLIYQGEHLGGYAGESVVIRYDPRDITTVFVYQQQESKEVFLTRAHAQGWETEMLSYREAQALSARRREAGKAIGRETKLSEVREREERVKALRQEQKQKQKVAAKQVTIPSVPGAAESKAQVASIKEEGLVEASLERERTKNPVPFVRVYDYEELKRQAGLL
jgi:putative transposase